jgi:hypothetical protein
VQSRYHLHRICSATASVNLLIAAARGAPYLRCVYYTYTKSIVVGARERLAKQEWVHRCELEFSKGTNFPRSGFDSIKHQKRIRRRCFLIAISRVAACSQLLGRSLLKLHHAGGGAD